VRENKTAGQETRLPGDGPSFVGSLRSRDPGGILRPAYLPPSKPKIAQKEPVKTVADSPRSRLLLSVADFGVRGTGCRSPDAGSAALCSNQNLIQSGQVETFEECSLFRKEFGQEIDCLLQNSPVTFPVLTSTSILRKPGFEPVPGIKLILAAQGHRHLAPEYTRTSTIGRTQFLGTPFKAGS